MFRIDSVRIDSVLATSELVGMCIFLVPRILGLPPWPRTDSMAAIVVSTLRIHSFS